jgi:MFS superfamily sulfate permease-like transporter
MPKQTDNLLPGTFAWSDLLAGLAIAGLLLPEAVAYSSMANLPPQTGVIALFAGLLCYALVGSSRFAIVSATSSSAAVFASAMLGFGAIDPALRAALGFGLVIVTGVLFMLAGLFKMGKVTDFISKPVLRGFAFGLAIVIIVKQFASMTQVHSSETNVFLLLPDLLRQLPAWNWVSIGVGATALVLLFVFDFLKRLPGGLLVIAIGIACSQWLNLPQYHVQLVGAMPLRLEMPTLPTLSLDLWMRLFEIGFALVMILYSESYSSIRVFAIKHGDETAPNRDLVALGIANLVAGLFHGMPVGAGYSGTSANEAAGASSRFAGLFAAAVMLVIVLLALPYIALTPEPVLAAIVIFVLSHTLNPAALRPYFRWQRDRLVLVAAVLAVLCLGILHGLLVAIAVSLFMLLQRLAETSLSELGQLRDGHDFVLLKYHADARPLAGMVILRPEAALFFANVEHTLNAVKQVLAQKGADTQAVILSLEESPDLDSTSLEALLDFSHTLSSTGKQLVLARLKPPVYELLHQVLTPYNQRVAITDLSVDDAVHMVHDSSSR